MTDHVRQWTKSDLLGVCLLLNNRGDSKLADLVWGFCNRSKGGANAVVKLPPGVSEMFQLIWEGKPLPDARTIQTADLQRLRDMANRGPNTRADDHFIDSVIDPLLRGEGQ